MSESKLLPDTKGPTGVLTLPSGSFSLGQELDFSLTYDESVTTSGGNPFVILEVGDRVRLAELAATPSGDSSVINFDYKVANSDFDNNGLGITATTGLSKSEFQLSGSFTAGDTIAVSDVSTDFTVQSGATSAEHVATGLRIHLNSQSDFTSAGLKSAGLGSGKIAIVGGVEAKTMTPSVGKITKDSSNSYTLTLTDQYANDASANFSLSGDASGITVDGGSAGTGVDGYVEGTQIFADNDGDGKMIQTLLLPLTQLAYLKCMLQAHDYVWRQSNWF